MEPMTDLPMSQPIDQSLVRFAELLADTARQITLRHFRCLDVIETKEDATPVSVADRETERAIRSLISLNYPTHGIEGEEFAATQADSPWLWVIDPIDGTKSFVTGKPTFGCLIALLYENEPQLGIIDMPALSERWLGVAGQTTQFNSATCATRTTENLSEATLYATTIDMFAGPQLGIFDSISRSARFRHFGGDCYAYGLLAAGHVDLVMEAGLKRHDYLALAPVIKGSGGCISDWRGEPLGRYSGDTVLASANQRLHEQVLAMIRSVQNE